MIGGVDIVMPGGTGPTDARVILERLRVLWPDGVYHDAESTTPHSLSAPLSSSTLGAPGEFLVYSNADAFRSWATDGATRENADQVLHFFVEPSSLTFVVQAEASPVATVVSGIMTELALRRAQTGE